MKPKHRLFAGGRRRRKSLWFGKNLAGRELHSVRAKCFDQAIGATFALRREPGTDGECITRLVTQLRWHLYDRAILEHPSNAMRRCGKCACCTYAPVNLSVGGKF